MAIATLEIPIFPLGTVLYPEGLLPLRIFEQRYLEMTKTCIRDNAPFGVCLIREGKEVGAPAVSYDIGCTARIEQWDMPHLGLFELVSRGESVFRIQEQWTTKIGLIEAQVELQEPVERQSLPAEFAELADVLQKIMNKLGAERFAAPARMDDSGWVAYRLAELLPLDNDVKQRLLESRDPVECAREVHDFLRTRQVVL